MDIGPGSGYELVGHKYFVSAPMCDGFLVLAQAPGEEGRGVATILEMVAMTRFDCMLGSSAGMRRAFGKRLYEQPLMQNVLADLVLEHEAALLVSGGNPSVADAFCASRLAGECGGRLYGDLPAGVNCAQIIDRATPAL